MQQGPGRSLPPLQQGQSRTLDLVCPLGHDLNPERAMWARRIIAVGWMNENTFQQLAVGWGVPSLTRFAARSRWQDAANDAIQGDAHMNTDIVVEISVRVRTGGMSLTLPE